MRVDDRTDWLKSPKTVGTNHTRSWWRNWRAGAACAVLLSTLPAGCIGGQTTVPTSHSPECKPIAMRYFGPHTLDVSWERSTGSTANAGTTLLTVDVSRAAGQPATPCETLIYVRVEVSSDDGVVELSGTGRLLREMASLRVSLDPVPGLEGGTLLLGETLELELDYPNGDRFSASGALDLDTR